MSRFHWKSQSALFLSCLRQKRNFKLSKTYIMLARGGMNYAGVRKTYGFYFFFRPTPHIRFMTTKRKKCLTKSFCSFDLLYEDKTHVPYEEKNTDLWHYWNVGSSQCAINVNNVLLLRSTCGLERKATYVPCWLESWSSNYNTLFD